jgi:PAS domain-containing protein
MKNSDDTYNETLQLFIVIAATIGAILPSVFSLTHGIYEVFPFLYILPIILVVYFYPRYGVLYSLGMSLVYIGIVYYFGPFDDTLIAISTAWFAIFITIGVVASSYANRLRNEAAKIRKVFEHSKDGLFCIDRRTKRLAEINPVCARMLRYERGELIGRDLSVIWPDGDGIDTFLARIKNEPSIGKFEVMLSAKDGTPCRCLISAILSSDNLILCSAFDLSSQKLADQEIRRTLEDLERQVRERTAHLEKINEELKAEILERRQYDAAIRPDEQQGKRKGGDRP